MIALQWQGQVLSLLNQSKYPAEESWVTCTDVNAVADALKTNIVADEKLAAVAGAYGYALAAVANQGIQNTPAFAVKMGEIRDKLLAARNTRDMALAMKFMENPPEAYKKNADPVTTILATAVTFERDMVVGDRNICRNGTDIMAEGTRLLVHTNKGVFHSATPSGALGIARRGVKRNVLETLAIAEAGGAGAALSKELDKDNVAHTVITDASAATFLARQGAHLVLTDGILAAKNGDLLAPSGAYGLAISCYFHSIPFYAVMNADNVDLDMPDGTGHGTPEGYDVLPAFLITGYITDRNIVCAPYEETLEETVKHAPKKMIVDFSNLGGM